MAFGMRVLFHDENTPGRIGALSQAWPAAQIERGIIAARGRAGDNAGARAIVALLNARHRNESRRLVSAARPLTAPKWSSRSYV
jgi:hypothetical protein